MATIFKSQKDLAYALIEVIDKYWGFQLEDEELVNQLKDLCDKNQNLLFKENQYTTMIRQRLGAKRLNLLTYILKNK